MIFWGQTRKDGRHFILVLFHDATVPFKPREDKKKKKNVAKIQPKVWAIMTSPPCGPISLHLKVTLPSSDIHCSPLMAVLQHVHCLHPYDKEGRNGQWV